MAQQHMRYTFNLQDVEGTKAPCTIYGTYDDSSTVATLVTDLAAFKGLIAAATDAQVIGSEATLVQTGSAAPGGFEDSDVSQVAEFNFTNTAGRTWTVVLPARKDAAVSSGHINLSETAIAALRTQLEESSGTFLMTDRNWLRTGALKAAFLGSREHRKALKRESLEIPS